MHALFLLAFKKSESSLPIILNLFRQGEELLRFWFGNLLTMTAKFVLGYIGPSNIDALTNYLKEERLSYESKIVLTHGMLRIGLKYPEKNQSEIVEAYREIFTYFVAHKENKQLIETDLISQMVRDCFYLDSASLSKIIQTLYDCDLVEPNMVGDRKTVLKKIKNPNYKDPYSVPFFDNIYELYEYVCDNWLEEDINEEGTAPDNFIDFFSPQSTISTPDEFEDYSDVGRNDPCPCGSGRKYKHCCLD